jgi:hypothetical protein
VQIAMIAKGLRRHGNSLRAIAVAAPRSRGQSDAAFQTCRGFQRRSGGLCVEVSVPVSPSFRFSPVGLDDDGRGLCVELVLPIVCPEES